MSFDLTPIKPGKSGFSRIFACIFKQRSKLIKCPTNINLTGKNILITGGTAGIGEFISRGLHAAGANVTSLSRGISNCNKSVKDVESLNCDLSNPESISRVIDYLSSKKFDILICNSGIMSKTFQLTPSGLERTYAVNVVGHHLLYRLLIDKRMLNNNARIIITTGEAYQSHSNTAATINTYNGMKAYGSSKLANLWQVLGLSKHYPMFKAIAIHPGVIASGFANAKKSGFYHWLRTKLLISEEEGAQAALIAATQNIPNGAYWHNTLGIVDLPEDDIAKNPVKANEQWQELETICRPWLTSSEIN